MNADAELIRATLEQRRTDATELRTNGHRLARRVVAEADTLQEVVGPMMAAQGSAIVGGDPWAALQTQQLICQLAELGRLRVNVGRAAAHLDKLVDELLNLPDELQGATAVARSAHLLRGIRNTFQVAHHDAERVRAIIAHLTT